MLMSRMPKTPDNGSSLQRRDRSSWFSSATILASIMATAATAAVALVFDPNAAVGLAIGGGAATFGFWMMARRTRTLHSIPKEEIPYRVYRWTFSRMILYALALFLAYQADPEGQHALLGAACGLLIPRAVMMVTGLIAWRHDIKARSGKNHD
jgi:hypothetical protein